MLSRDNNGWAETTSNANAGQPGIANPPSGALGRSDREDLSFDKMRRSMRVLHATETMKGGVGSVLRHLLLHRLATSGSQSVHAVVPDAHIDELKTVPKDNLSCFRRSGRNLSSFASFGATLRRAVQHFQPDVVHLHSTFAGGLGRLTLRTFARGKVCPVVYTPHGFAFMIECPRWTRYLLETAEARLSALSDAIICVSQFERDSAAAAGIPTTRLRRIYNGVPAPKWLDQTHRGGGDAARAPSKSNRISLLFVGRFDRQKGLDVLLSAMALLPPDRFELAVVGAAVNDTTGQMQRPNVRFAGWVPHQQLGTYYAAADVLVMPSRWEGFPLVALEAYGHGLPVLGSRCCSMPELIKDGETGRLFDVDRSEQIAAILQTTSRSDWRRMGLAGRQFVGEFFTHDAMLDETDALYAELVQARSARHAATEIAQMGGMGPARS